ncbi:MAG: NAD(P)H-binding protein [Gammaproteobacteria bacterium]|nr:NAD(P)H-binding protein [Gammaproteobacteria bacterium]
MGKIAIVIGATGLVGQALVNRLAGADHIDKVITLTRRPAEHQSSKVFNRVVDFDHLEDYASSFANSDFLFSCLGTTINKAGTIAAQRRVDLDYQYRAAQLAANSGVAHYLLVSSNGANAQSNNAYLKMKGELELKIKTLPFKRITIFQPSLLLGKRPEFRLAEKLGSLLLPVLYLIPWLRRYRPISGEQVAAKMVQVSQQPGDALEWFRLDRIF